MAQGKVRGRIARAAISAALTGAMAFGGVMAPASVALANTIEVSNHKDGTTYKFYQVFKGSVNAPEEPGGNYTPGDLEWAKPEMKNAVVGFLLDNNGWDADGNGVADYCEWLEKRGLIASASAGPYGVTEVEAANLEANVIAFITPLIDADEQAGASIPASNGDLNNGKHVTQPNTFTNELSKVVANLTADKEDASKWENDAASGYILVIPSTSTNGEAPVWVANVGDATITITRKEELPSLLKEVKDGGGGTFAKIDDIDSGEEAIFQLTIITPDADGSKEATVTDTLPEGLTYVANSAKLDNVANEPTVAGQTLTFTFTPESSAVNHVITYSATLSDKAKTGAKETNDNSAFLKWGEDSTVKNVAKVATYQLDFSKVDEDGNALAGASFAIKKGDQYVQDNGTLGTGEYYFAVDGEGKLTLPFFVDADTYTVIEQAPEGYEKIEDFTITIESELDGDKGEIKSLTAKTDNNLITAEADPETGIITITVPNENEIILPITGMTPSQLGTLIGALLVAVGTVAILKRRQQGTQA